MRLYPKTLDNTTLLDIQKARNANELMLVVARLNNRYRTMQRQVSKLMQDSTSPMTEYYKQLSEILKLQQELQAANTVAMNLVDLKRDRCRNVIMAIHTEMKSVKQDVLVKTHALASSALSGTITKLSDYVHDMFRKRSQKVLLLNMHDGDHGYIVNTLKGVDLPSGYVASEIHVKLREREGQVHVCLPSEPFMDSEYYPVSTKAGLKATIERVLSYNNSSSVPNTELRPILDEPCVVKVNVTDTLDLHIDDLASASDINNLLKVTVPLLKKAVGADSFDILHRMDLTPEGRVLRFATAKKAIVDTQALNRLYRILKLGRAEAKEATALMEPL